MDERRRKKIKGIVTLISIVMLVAVVGYIVYAVVRKQLDILVFQIILGSFLLIYFVLMDIIEPLLLKQFDGITKERQTAYWKFLGIDAVGIGALVFFVYTLGQGSEGETGSSYGLIAALVYLFTSRHKTKFRDEFLGIKKEEIETKEETEEKTEDETEDETEE